MALATAAAHVRHTDVKATISSVLCVENLTAPLVQQSTRWAKGNNTKGSFIHLHSPWNNCSDGMIFQKMYPSNNSWANFCQKLINN
jgi:hypothetical protein